jgi:hypothetical protein
MSQPSSPQPDPAAGGDLAEALGELARIVYERGEATEDAWFLNHAHKLSELAEQARERYVPLLAADEEVPTSAQGVALARFVRPHLRDRRGSATVCRGPRDLPEGYLCVRCDDGYEGGIDREGRVST